MSPNQRILIVDDDADIRTSISRLLRGLGYRVCEAADGYSAFTHARQLNPTLIVLDLCLPGQDGWTVAQEIRAEAVVNHSATFCFTLGGNLL